LGKDEQVPLCSSRQVVKAFKRAGFTKRGKSDGSHQAMVRERPPPARTVIVLLGKKEISRYTLRQMIVDQAGMTVTEFKKFLR
jgi:predicted RNA binding protein YcfA (HicA-like mRNA interferase family)